MEGFGEPPIRVSGFFSQIWCPIAQGVTSYPPAARNSVLPGCSTARTLSIKYGINAANILKKKFWKENSEIFYVLLTVFLGIILFNDKLDTQFFFVYVHFNSLHVSSIQVLIIRRFNCINTISGTCHLHRVTCTRYRIDTIESPDDEHLNARNM